MEKRFDWKEILDIQGIDWEFGTCQRPDGSMYGHGGKNCHQGVPVNPHDVGITRDTWRDLGKVYGSATTAAAGRLSATLDKLTPAQRKDWEEVIADGCVDTQIITKLTGGKTLDESGYDGQMAKRMDGYDKLIREGPPKQFTLRNGDPIDVADPQPVVTGMGQGKWVNPETGMRHSHETGRQVATGAIDVARRAGDGVEYREKVLANPPKETNNRGDKWPVQELPKSQQLDPDKILSEMTNAERKAVSQNGLSMTKKGSPQNDVFEELQRNPEMREKRLREIVERYAEQGGMSGVSGKPVALPGLKPGPGQETSSVDHHTPISTATSISKGGTIEQIRGTIDNKKNFLIAEESLNKQRGDRDWNTEIGRMKAAADADVASSRVVGNPKSYASLGQRKGGRPATPGTNPPTSTPSSGRSSNRGSSTPRENTGRRSTSGLTQTEKNEKELEKMQREIKAARAKRASKKEGTKGYKNASDEVNKLLTKERKFKKENGLL